VSVATDSNISRTLAAQQQQQRKQLRRPASVSTFTQPKAATEASDTDPVTAAPVSAFPFHLFPAAMQVRASWKDCLRSKGEGGAHSHRSAGGSMEAALPSPVRAVHRKRQ
jgi:hypothetical protein